MMGRWGWWLLGLLLLASCVAKPIEQKEAEQSPNQSPNQSHNLQSKPADSVAEKGESQAGTSVTVRPLRERLALHIDRLADAGGNKSRVVFTPGNRWGVEYIVRQFQEAGVAPLRDTFTAPFWKVKGWNGRDGRLANVIAEIPGASDSVVVLCAHLDASGSRDPGWKTNWQTAAAPGANDNGSGIAALIEIVREVASAKPRYTLVAVASNAEEKNPDYAGHHHGSRAVAERLRREGKKVRAVVVMDMVGWSPNGASTMLFADARSRPLAASLRKLNQGLNTGLVIPAATAPCRNSDNEAFAAAGFPTVLFMESCTPWRATGLRPRNPTYHTRRDTPATVNLSVTEAVVKLVSEWVD
ncbi:MAG: Zn-dependent exopeptidase M28 [Chlorobi bacterium]|nr:Zn-dependent exopeptidase M28 [Chlorobiota bacterium]